PRCSQTGAEPYTLREYPALGGKAPSGGVFHVSPLVPMVLIPTAPRQAGRATPTTGGGSYDMAKGKKAFGGYSINFKGCKDSVEAVFGGSPIGPSDMTTKLWACVKGKKLAGKREP